MLENILCFISSFFVNTYMCNACRIVIVFVKCVYNKYCTNTCTIIIVIAVSRVNVEVTKRNKQRGAHPKSRYTRTCVQKVNLYEYIIHVVAILVLIVSLSCQIISLIYKVFISLELCSLFSHYFPLTLTPLDYLLKKNDEILIRNANL